MTDKINQQYDRHARRLFGPSAAVAGSMGSPIGVGNVRILLAGRTIGSGDTFAAALRDAQATARREIGRQADSLMLTRPDALQGN